jgi:NTP pyrophosphatase (non-canonical NTP hydrolase)
MHKQPGNTAGGTTIAELTDLVLKFVQERDWEQFHNAKDMALSLTLEAAEVLELTQWKSGPELQSHMSAHVDELGDELSDVLFWVLEMSHRFQIDLPAAFRKKMARNAEKYPVEKAKGLAKKYTEL